MCCMFTSLVLFGPRIGILVWWLLDQPRWELAFDTFWWPFLGFIFAPWTTLMYVTVFPGGVTGFDWIIMGIGVLADISTWTSSAVEGRRYQAAY